MPRAECVDIAYVSLPEIGFGSSCRRTTWTEDGSSTATASSAGCVAWAASSFHGTVSLQAQGTRIQTGTVGCARAGCALLGPDRTGVARPGPAFQLGLEPI